ncbi:MAG TPA: hypothetical protein VM370_07590 [Candidatus Thermoplasmatota archaeon]|nr:hypothetical protein [Candidatus Thermoplasmatota archaeon]
MRRRRAVAGAAFVAGLVVAAFALARLAAVRACAALERARCEDLGCWAWLGGIGVMLAVGGVVLFVAAGRRTRIA